MLLHISCLSLSLCDPEFVHCRRLTLCKFTLSHQTQRRQMYFLFTLSGQLLWAAHIISVFRAAGTIIAGDGGNGGRFLTCVAWKSRWFKKEKGGRKKKKVWLYGNYVWLAGSQRGVQPFVFIAFAQSEWPPPPFTPLFPPPLCVCCSLSLLRSLSEDWGEPVSSCDEGLLRDAAAVHEPRGWSHTEVTGRRRRSEALKQPHCPRTFIHFNCYTDKRAKGLSLWLCSVCDKSNLKFKYKNTCLPVAP